MLGSYRQLFKLLEGNQPLQVFYTPPPMTLAPQAIGHTSQTCLKVSRRLICRRASIFAGGLAPLIAVWLYTRFDTGYAVSWYVLASAALTILAVGTYHETRHRDLAADHAVDRATR